MKKPDKPKRDRPLVAIDGPAGSGKTTVARHVAVALGYSLVDTGALYRCVALMSARAGIRDDDELGLSAIAAELCVRFESAGQAQRVFVDQEDVTDLIRQPEVSERASRISVHPGVRTALLTSQREMGRDGGVVLEGRDIGTVVFPDAEIKVFLKAGADVRARRRFEELRAKGVEVSLDKTFEEMVQRDQRDEAREVAPLKPAADAVIIDTGPLSIEDVGARIVALVEPNRRRGRQET